ncbi:hypothetical protein [uncultured Brevundimonas sp.]|uniref:hypothetical protein n=1 Tax=uncultured Brevundimonas sp. TaxID=213418 RepID=UPI0025E3F71A|nr:hypothetical protein [uncultured Brevundimonas sp.]
MGGQQGEAAGCAENEVGRAVYERIEKLLKTDPTGWERAYLCHLVGSVEEVGGYDGPRLDDFPYRKTVAAFLKLRDESVGPDEADDEERLESADIILSLTTPARAEAQDEGAAGEPVAWAFRCRDSKSGWMLSQSAPTNPLIVDRPQVWEVTPLYAHPSPTPAADADWVRIAKALRKGINRLRGRSDSHTIEDRKFMQTVLEEVEALAALKSTAAKEGGEA